MVTFHLSSPPSQNSSRSPSPAPSPPVHHFKSRYVNDLDNDTDTESVEPDVVPGRLPVDVYDVTLPPWRAAVRRWLVACVKRESDVVARLQEKIRAHWLDAYFVYTSSLGTHTFFMTALPALYFFGYDELARGLLVVLGAGVYFSSVVKDLFCSPRPYSPPVTRLTMGSHHLEYGFPSTHSTNSVSIALFLFSHVYDLAFPSAASTKPIEPTISPTMFAALTFLLTIYTFSIVFGRIYTAMHSFTDCVVGVLLGTAIWWACSDWTGIPITITLPSIVSGIASLPVPANYTLHLGAGLGLEKRLWEWTTLNALDLPPSPTTVFKPSIFLSLFPTPILTILRSYCAPIITIPLSLLLVHYHPQPVDDCPCFEDAIAFASVVVGALLGRWTAVRMGVVDALTLARNSKIDISVILEKTRNQNGTIADIVKTIRKNTILMPGSGWVYVQSTSEWMQVDRGWRDVGIWWSVAVLKMTLGILAIFTWRLLAKALLRSLLPPTFRILSKVWRLPQRRFYTPATEYEGVGVVELQPVPSVIDLPGSFGLDVDADEGVIYRSGRKGGRDTDGSSLGMKLRKGKVTEKKLGEKFENTVKGVREVGLRSRIKDEEGKRTNEVKHYDADVLTKVIVYAGIAVLAAEALPVTFEALGLGVRSWVDL